MKILTNIFATLVVFAIVGCSTEDSAYATSEEHTLKTQEGVSIKFNVVPNAIEESTTETTAPKEDTNSDTIITIDTYPSDGSVALSGESVIYTPNPDFNGKDYLKLHLGDPSNVDYKIYKITILVESDGNAPILSGNPTTSIKTDEYYSFRPSVDSKYSTNNMVFTIANKPYWASFNGGTGELYGQAPKVESLTKGIVISVYNGKDHSSLKSFDIQVFSIKKSDDQNQTDDSLGTEEDQGKTNSSAENSDTTDQADDSASTQEDQNETDDSANTQEDQNETDDSGNDPTDKGDHII